MHCDLNRQLEELNMDANSAMLRAATMEPPVPLQESDIVDPSRRCIFKYAMRDVESLQTLLNAEIDASALAEEIDGILSNWRLLFPTGGRGLTGGLARFMEVLEQLLAELRGDGSHGVERALREKTSAIEETFEQVLKEVEKVGACAREQRDALSALLQQGEMRIRELQASLAQAEEHYREVSDQLSEVNRKLSYTSSVSEDVRQLRSQVDLEAARSVAAKRKHAMISFLKKG